VFISKLSRFSLQVILNHLYREGHFDVAESLAEEAALPEDAAQDAKEKFSEMHRHLELVSRLPLRQMPRQR
jgi:hypothetical protein